MHQVGFVTHTYVRYFVVLVNSTLITITLYSLVITTLVYNDKKSPFRDVITEFGSVMNHTPLSCHLFIVNKHYGK
jgi:hypothetical protein